MSGKWRENVGGKWVECDLVSWDLFDGTLAENMTAHNGQMVSEYVGTKEELLHTGVVPPAAFELGDTRSGPRTEAYDEFGTKYRIEARDSGMFYVTKWYRDTYNAPRRDGPYGSPYDVDLTAIMDRVRKGPPDPA